MDRLPERGSNRLRGNGRPHSGLGALIWIVILLSCWLLIAEWRMLPEMVNAAMTALS